MFNTVVVATDLSAASDALIDGLALLRPLGAETAVLCHALGIHGHETLYPMFARFVEPRIRQQQERLERLGFKVVVEMVPGIPALEIHRIAAERGAGLIAVGSRGTTLAREILLGGTATEVLHHARVPVLVVRLAIDEENGALRPRVVVTGPIRGVLHPTDFSAGSAVSFATIEELASLGVARIHLLHISGVELPEFVRSASGKLEGMRQRLYNRGAEEVTTEILTGSPGPEIVARAARGDSELVVMGCQGHGLLEEVFLGGESHYVARHASVPVLLVPLKGVKSPVRKGGTS